MADDGFRARAREWLAGHAGPSDAGVFADTGDADRVARGKAWQRELAEAGWAGLGWPVEHGGQGLPVSERVVWAQELAAAGVAPGINLVGEVVVGPALMAHGTAEQRQRYLPPILRADEIWCQLFSEPEAGTDLAAVSTGAVASGDGWVVTGEKTWISAAHYADLGLLLARTDPRRHEGLTCFVVDMGAPGVTVIPVRQMTGGTGFCRVVLDGVQLPDDARVGPVGGGWEVVMTALASERLELALGATRAAGGLGRLLASLRAAGVADEPGVVQIAAQAWIDARLVELMGERGAEPSLVRLAAIRASRRGEELLDTMRGAGAMLVDEWTPAQLWAPATRIGGGTEEVLRTVVGQRVLGLPPS